MIRIEYGTHFKKAFTKLSPEIQQRAYEKEVIFRENMFHPSLRTHKLKGELSECWSFSVTYKYRVLFTWIDSARVGFIDIGTHNIYQ